MSQRLLTLVKSNKMRVAYPRTDKDFVLLRELGASVRIMSVEFLPLLEDYAGQKKMRIDVLTFEDIEAKALENLERKWPGEFQRLKGQLTKIVLSCPKDTKHRQLMVSVKRALVKFYKTHGFKVTYLIKRGPKTVKVTFIAEPLSEFFNQYEV
jgi:hypothetical protein